MERYKFIIVLLIIIFTGLLLVSCLQESNQDGLINFLSSNLYQTYTKTKITTIQNDDSQETPTVSIQNNPTMTFIQPSTPSPSAKPTCTQTIDPTTT